jgi:PAS domain S-box-containing protein
MDHPPLPPDSSRSNEHETSPFHAELFAHLPVLVVRLSAAGIVLDMNAAVTRVTGYERSELLGRNWWSTLFPGKLFQQVPRFMSARSEAALFRDTPLTLRCKDGSERIVAWNRYARDADWAALQDGKTATEWVCIGTDLTQRLDDADRAAASAAIDEPPIEQGDPIEQAGADQVAGDFIEPLAILPPPSDFAAKSAQKAAEDVERLLRLAGENGDEAMIAMHQARVPLDPMTLADLHARIAEITLMCGRGTGGGRH